MTWRLLVCPRCRLEFRKDLDCTAAVRRAEEAERRSAKVALENAELKRQIGATGVVVGYEAGRIDSGR